MKPRCILFSLAAILVAFSCGKTQEEEKPVIQPEIKIPTESQAVFSSGISFPEYSGTSPQETAVKFTATESWTTDVNDTKVSSWLSVRPTSGGAGTVNMTVSAQPNPGETGRSAKVTIKCGTVTKTFSVTQAGNPPAVIAVESVSLDKTELSMVEEEETTLIATVKPENATDKTVTWSSSDASIATVENGKVKAVKEGTATITAKASEKSETCAVTVSKKVIAVESVTLDKTEITLTEGEETTLTATVKPDDATDKTVLWETSDASIATVEDGNVKAIKEGGATITATAGEKSASCKVTVAKKVIAVESVTLNKAQLNLVKGESETLVATVKPDDATDKTVTWSSSNTDVAIVENGKVAALGAGTATIEAKAGEKKAVCEVAVTIPVESVTLDHSTITIEEGQSTTLIATVSPSDATDKTVSWTSSDATVATVDNGKVTGIKEGTVAVTALAGGKVASCVVTVCKKVIPVTSISLNKSSLDLKKGQSETLVATVKPDDATDKTVTWTSSDATVASVDQSGKVTATGGGSATITAKAGEKSAVCTVSVTVPVNTISLDKSSLSIEEGQTASLIATVNPEDATNKTVIWSTSNASVASVENGTVTAVKEGTATITAKAGDKTAECKITVSKKVVAVTSVELNRSSLELKKGESETLIATVKPDDATDKSVTWSTSNATVASVDESGKVTALKSGTATITAKAGDKSATCFISITTPVESVSMDRTSVSLEEGQSTTLVATINPSDADEQTVTWSTSNGSVASVTNGVVTAVAEGEAIITAKVGNKEATCKVLVKKKVIEVTSVTLNKTNLDLKKGESETLIATVKPEDATDKTVIWSTSNASVASVENGTVTAVKEGTATITAKAGDKTAECKITVSKKVIAVTSVELNRSSLELKKGESETLIATVKPDDATEKTVTWSSSNSDVATVDSNGLVIALSAGTVAITAKAGDKTASCAVTVNVPVTSITLDNTSLALEEGATAKITATVSPDDATDKTVTWTSSNTDVATVSGGTVTAVKEGEAIITAKAGEKEATCKVTVKKKVVAVTSVTLNKTSLDLKKGESETLTATVAPNDATDKTVTWSTSDASVASVDQNGKVTAMKTGYATITAKAGEKSASCSVKVTTPVESVTLNQTSASIEEGKTITLVATINPNDADEQTVTWTTSNDKVATVSNGVVTAVAEGTCTITAKVGGKSAECKVTVTIVPNGGNEGVGYDEWD